MRFVEQPVFPSSLKPLGGSVPAGPPGSYVFDEEARFDDSQTYLVPKTCFLNKRFGNADPTRIPDPYQLGFHAPKNPTANNYNVYTTTLRPPLRDLSEGR